MPFFVNIVGADKAEVVRHATKSQVGNFMRMGSFLGTLASEAQDSQATGETLAQQAAEMVTEILRSKGLMTAVSISFVRELFIVLRVSVLDPSGRPPQPTQAAEADIFEMLGCCSMCKSVPEQSGPDFQMQLEASCVDRLGPALISSLGEQGVTAMVQCCSERDEQRYLASQGYTNVWLPGKELSNVEFIVKPRFAGLYDFGPVKPSHAAVWGLKHTAADP
mmetsp:Transcript_10140/g.21919  ORF Transcript_10140/g.21919 Transcript_10140/m.21919 type:complete len:221 (-) Transcript_10140:116-778(-)